MCDINEILQVIPSEIQDITNKLYNLYWTRVNKLSLKKNLEVTQENNILKEFMLFKGARLEKF